MTIQIYGGPQPEARDLHPDSVIRYYDSACGRSITVEQLELVMEDGDLWRRFQELIFTAQNPTPPAPPTPPYRVEYLDGRPLADNQAVSTPNVRTIGEDVAAELERFICFMDGAGWELVTIHSNPFTPYPYAIFRRA